MLNVFKKEYTLTKHFTSVFSRKKNVKDCFFISVSTFLLLVLFTTNVKSATIKGRVLDAKSKEGLIGAPIYSKEDKQVHDAAGLDGSFSIKNLKPGTYTFAVQFIGYTTQEKTVVIKEENENIKLDFLLEASSVNLGEVNIVAKTDRESDDFARRAEKNSDNVINVVSAKSIELSPDLAVGNVLQRVSGVNVEKSSSGEGRYATIRGMDKRYNYTLIDGIKIPTPDNKNRYVPMDIFPSEIVERLEVIKSLTPSMEGDAIGGVMNLVLKEAPDHFIFNANAASGFNQQLFDRSGWFLNPNYMMFNTKVINNQSPSQVHPGAGATASDFPLQNYDYKNAVPLPDAFAALTIGNRFYKNKMGVIFSTSYQNSFSSTKSLFITPSAQPNANNQPIFDDIEVRKYSIQQTRGAAHLKLDYEFNKKHKISFYTVYVGLNQIRQRQFSDTIASINAGEVDQHYESKVTHQYIYNATLHGDDTLAHNLKLDWSLPFSIAGANIPDWGSLVTTGSATSTAATWQSFSRRWMQNTDKDISGYINLTYNLKIKEEPLELKIGAMNRDKTRDNFIDDYKLTFSPQQPVGSIYNANFSVSNPLGSPHDFNDYTVQENVTAFYGQAKFSIGSKIQILGGVRFENTALSYVTAAPITIPGQNGSIKYLDMLPSASIKYSFNEKHKIRASYFASISRPSFFDIIPATTVGEYFDEYGNPFLKHTQADNYDLRYEFFPGPSEQILAGVFYKNITNPIEYTFYRESISTLWLEPENFGNATNYGFEFVAIKYIRHFGISANYTYTKSQITTDKLLYSTHQNISETRPLQGQADHIANLSLLYKNPLLGLDMQLSAVYTGKLISQVSPYSGLDYWQMPMTRLDFSFEKKISKKLNLSLYGKINNILNTALIVRILQPNPYTTPGPYWLPWQDDSQKSILVEKEQYGQSYLAGIRYKF